MLAGPITGPFRSPCVVGNLACEEARTFFFNYVLPSGVYPSGADEAWQRVYEVCGGNPGLLQKCAGEASAFNSWEDGAFCSICCFASDASPHGARRVRCNRAERDDRHR